MGDQFWKADQFGKYIQYRTMFGGFSPARWRLLVCAQMDDPFLLGNGMYKTNTMVLKKPIKFGFNTGKIAGLNLDQEILANNIYNKAVDGHLELVTGLGVPSFQGGMQRGFPQGANLRWGGI